MTIKEQEWANVCQTAAHMCKPCGIHWTTDKHKQPLEVWIRCKKIRLNYFFSGNADQSHINFVPF